MILVLNQIAYFFKSVVNIISFFGATVNIYLVFIMPSKINLFYLNLVCLYLKATSNDEKYKYYRILSILLLIFTVSIGLIYVTTLIFETFTTVY